MADAPARVYLGQPGTTDTTLYTAGAAGTYFICRSIHVVNTTATLATFTLSIGAVAAAVDLFAGQAVYPNDVFDWTGMIPLLGSATTPDTIHALQGTAGALTVCVSGITGPYVAVSRGLNILAGIASQVAATVATLTAAQPVIGTPVAGGTAVIAVPAGTIAVNAMLSGTYSIGQLAFEGSPDNATWYPLSAQRINLGYVENADYPAANETFSELIPVAGYSYIRVRAVSYTSGTATVRLVPLSHHYNPPPVTSYFNADAQSAAPAQSVNAFPVVYNGSTWDRQRGSNGVQYAAVSSPAAAPLGVFGQVNPYGTQRVSAEPTVVFFDPFDGSTVDTTNRWTASGTQLPTQAAGAVSIAPTVGASVANTSVLVSQPSFASPGLGFTIFGLTVTLEASQTNAVNVHRFWGKGQVTTYAYATPVTDGVGFEVDGATGALQCVVYIAGVKYVINSTTATNVSTSIPGAGGTGTALPTGASGTNYGAAMTWLGGQHRYAIMVRSDVIFWYAEGQEKPVAALNYATPAVQTLPVRIAAATNGAATSLANTFQVGAMAVNDSTAQNHTLSDPTYHWRRATMSVLSATKTGLDVNVAGPPRASTSALTAPTVTSTGGVVLAANAARMGGTFQNDSGQILYLALSSTTATTAAYTVQLAAGAYYELPFGYTGAVTGILGAGTGPVRVTELTA